MSLASDARAATAPRGTTCTVRAAMATMSPSLRREFVAALEDPTVTYKGLHKALAARNINPLPSPSSLSRHNRKECRCG